MITATEVAKLVGCSFITVDMAEYSGALPRYDDVETESWNSLDRLEPYFSRFEKRILCKRERDEKDNQFISRGKLTFPTHSR
jgi:hypothetical protein